MKSETQIIVRYAETDRMGIVHHSNYAVWYEQARTMFIRELGMTYSDMEKQGVWLPLLSLECHYARPAFYEDRLTIQTKIGLLTPSRIRFDYTVLRGDEKKPLNTGSTSHAFTTPELRPMNLKKHYPDLYHLLESAMEEQTE